MHPLDPALEDQVDDQLHLVNALVVGHLGRVAGLDERLEPGLDQLGEPAAEHGLLAEEVGLGLLREGRLEDPGASAADAGGVGERDLAGVAGRVLGDRDQRRGAVALLVEPPHDVPGPLRRDHDDVDALGEVDPPVVNREAVGEEHGRAGLEVRGDLVAEERGLRPVGHEHRDDLRALHRVRDVADGEAGLLGVAARGALGLQPDDDLDARVGEVQRVRVPLAAVADDRDLPREETDVARLDDFFHWIPFRLRDGRGARPRWTWAGAAKADPAGTGELADAVGAHELFERVELLGPADDLEGERLAADVRDAGAEDLAERDQLGPLVGAARRP